MAVTDVNTSTLKWPLPEKFSENELRQLSSQFLDRPEYALKRTEDICEVEAAELDWDIGAIVYEPEDSSKIRTGPDGRKLGFFLLHGGAGDFKVHEQLARLLATRLGARVVNMTFPGRFYFDDPDHAWPGDTIEPDGTMRLPIWKRGETITPDQFDFVQDARLRHVYGTLQIAQAKEGTRFYDRLAGWPMAFEAAILALCAKHLPESEFSIYAHGHSTGGPFSHMLLQRVPNAVGITGIENSPFGYIWAKVNGQEWQSPFNGLVVRTWRDIARYHGAEVLRTKGPQALMSLPAVMEDVFARWDAGRALPNFKAEYILHVNCERELTAGAQATAKRLGLDADGTKALVDRYLGYAKPLTGPGVKPVPPLLYIICGESRDHTEQAYKEIILPELAKIDPAPKTSLFQFEIGAHSYMRPVDGLPFGLSPPAILIWEAAIMSGYYLK